jgi:carbon-monoxide dehydrogenase small subunit
VSSLQATVNGRAVRAEVAPNELLLDWLREDLGLPAVKQSCEVQVCGTCTVLLDGDPVSSCCVLAADVDGRRVETLEGLAGTRLHEVLAAAFSRHAAVQCGFCTSGMLLTAAALVARGDLDLTSPQAVREAMSGNLCRCTGYQSILDALLEAFAELGAEPSAVLARQAS